MALAGPGGCRKPRAVADIPKPVVAAITGYALAGGLELALAADPASRSGPGSASRDPARRHPRRWRTQRLPRLVGPAKAKDIVFSGRMVAVAEALQIGLVDQVVPDDGLTRRPWTWFSATPAGPSLALRAAKQAIDTGLGLDLATGLEIERVQFAALFGTEDAAGRHAQLPGKRPRQSHLHRPRRGRHLHRPPRLAPFPVPRRCAPRVRSPSRSPPCPPPSGRRCPRCRHRAGGSDVAPGRGSPARPARRPRRRRSGHGRRRRWTPSSPTA